MFTNRVLMRFQYLYKAKSKLMAETQNQAVWLKSKILITSLDSSQDVCMCNYTNELEGNM